MRPLLRVPAPPILATGILALATLAGCGSTSAPGTATTPLSAVKGYQAIPDPPLGPASQTVTETNGDRWSFASPEPGKVTLVYFGYTSCPDVCPLTMSDLAVATTNLPENLRDKVWVQFVSTDPHRDTPHRLHRWVETYSQSFHAARAPISDVIAAAKTYGISISPPKITKHDYQVTHGAQVLVLNSHGAEVGLFTELAGNESYAAALPTLIRDYA